MHFLSIAQSSLGKPQRFEILDCSGLANVLTSVGRHGKDGFYKGWVAEAMVAAVSEAGGVLSMQDLESHFSTFEDPISIEYKGTVIFLIF